MASKQWTKMLLYWNKPDITWNLLYIKQEAYFDEVPSILLFSDGPQILDHLISPWKDWVVYNFESLQNFDFYSEVSKLWILIKNKNNIKLINK